MKAALIGLSLVLMATVSCNRRPPDPREQVLARINGEPVYAQDFLVNFQQLKAEQDPSALGIPKNVEQLKTRALNEVLINTLLRHEAAKRQIRIAKEEVEIEKLQAVFAVDHHAARSEETV